MKNMREIEDIMSRNIATVDSDTTVEDAAKELKKHDIGSLIVTEGRKTVGIVTERDIAYKYVASQKHIGSKDIRVKDIMSRQLITTSIDNNPKIMDAIVLMDKYKIKRLGIIKKEKLIGILAEVDVFKELASSYITSYKKIENIKEMLRQKKSKNQQSKKR